MTTQAQNVTATTPSSRRRVVGYHPGISGFTACGVLCMFVIAWGPLSHPDNDTADLLNGLLPMCVVVTVFCLLGTSRVVVDPAGFIDMVDPLVLRRIPVSELVRVEHHDGLHLRVVSGRRFGSVAYGASLIGVLLRYPRSVRAARRIEAAVGWLPEAGEVPTWRADTATSHPRVRAYLVALGVDAALILGTVVLNVMRAAAQG